MSGNNNRRRKPNNTNKPLNQKVDAKVETIKQDVKDTTKDIKDNVTKTAKDVKNNVAEATKDTKEVAKEIKDSNKAQLHKTADKVTDTAKKVEDTIKKEELVKSDTKQNHTQKNTSDDMSNKNQGKNAQKPDNKTTGNDKKVTEEKVDTRPVTPAPVATEKKSGGLLAPLGLIAGIAGTVIGVYNYDQVRKLNTSDQTAALTQQLKSVESKVAELGGKNTDEVATQLKAQLDKLSKTIKTSEAKANERLSAVEQTQNGLTKTLQGDVQETLDKRLNEVNNLLSKVDQIELTQKSISQNLNQAVAAGEAVTAEGMAKQEVGYLLRMADYKVQSEGDAVGAAGLLEIAEKKLLLLNQGRTGNMVENIRQKYIQLQGVKPVDSNALISSLKKLSGIVPDLMPKPAEKAPEKAEKSTAEEAQSMLSQVGDIIASGIEYTPNDPSKIDISAETILIEKRLMQADIRTAELAVRSQNGVLLAETINSIRTNLDKYFANNDTAKTIRSTLANIEEQKLETVLPDLGSLVKQYEEQ